VRLQTFTVTNYRSITKAEKLDLTDFTVLVGPNNEGKSNILRAMVLGMRVLDRAASGIPLTGRGARSSFRRVLSNDYHWERDYPMQLQVGRPEGRTSLRYDFFLSDDEVEAFKQDIGSRINNELPVQIQLGNEQNLIQIPKKGPGKKSLSQKRDAIAQFVGQRIDVAYIPAVRQSEKSEDAVRRILDGELRRLEKDREYQKALDEVARIQQPTFDRVSDAIAETLREFIPDVTAVRVSANDDERYRALRQSLSIIVDDGYATDLAMKGDGVQSLAAVALMRHLTSSVGEDREVVLAIEEPESHLHPSAIHQLRRVLLEIADRQQVVITTHSPVFVNRTAPNENIVVQDNKARAASGVDEIREILGVHVADNLQSANRVILVEGESDRRIITALLRARLADLTGVIEEGGLVVECIGGSGKLPYRLRRLEPDVCDVFVIMDGDDAGRQAIEKATSGGIIQRTSTFLLSTPGQAQSELEDLIDPTLYMDAIERDVGIILRGSRFTQQRSKWSQRMARQAGESGQLWDRSAENICKTIVADCVVAAPTSAIHGGAEPVVDNLARRLSSWLDLVVPDGTAE
jgi:putative ATP-dependent endonuclease of OLD family